MEADAIGWLLVVGMVALVLAFREREEGDCKVKSANCELKNGAAAGGDIERLIRAIRGRFVVLVCGCGCGRAWLGLVWRGEVYVVHFSTEDWEPLVQTLGRWADDPELPTFDFPLAAAVIKESQRRVRAAEPIAGKAKEADKGMGAGE